MSDPEPEQRPVWITALAAGAILPCTRQRIAKLAEAGLISVKRVPGCYPLYLRSDVEELAKATIIPARVSAVEGAVVEGSHTPARAMGSRPSKALV